jgi:NADH-quinone oxidoreductase subunit B
VDGLDWYRVASDPSIRVGSVGLACCAVEVDSAVRLGLLTPERPAEPKARETALLVAGTVTVPLAAALRRVVADQRSRGPLRVVAFGACATSGGPYWDAPSVLAGADREIAVDYYVPGCPPRPDALVAALVAGGE